ncbi:MAG: Asp-tRNA(Asn)/Glu-tRNA(Gln) amidotransferase subunit GatC [Candidatus Dojkabacteria bacterium]|nr:MAG: Asp-tRNA(Asn)/Glu-tRNA(Gln) amidotransferase subunit GatC [Candidatus Dojkabacteria bacterium]
MATASKAKKENDKKILTKEEVLHLAHLVRLELTDEEVEKLQVQLSETIDFIDNLNELDTSNVKETSHAVSVQNVTFEDGAAPDRTFTQEEALKNAPKKKNGFFVVSKILNK